MSLNDIKIPAALLAELYSSVLITDEKINPALISSVSGGTGNSAPLLSGTLGENRKGVMVLVRYPGHPVIPDADLEFLTGILQACKLGLADVVICNLGTFTPGYQELKKQFSPKYCLLFGVTPEELDLPLRFPEFQLQSHTGLQFLGAPSLSLMKEDKIIKSKLWVSLRKLFNI